MSAEERASMPRAPYQVGTLRGFPIRIDPSWYLILVLLTWSLATGWFPSRDPDLSPATAWVMGAVATIGLFISLILHELSHAVVARRHGLVISGITLFIFGGVAEMTDEPSEPSTELRVALAGPAMSLVITILCAGAAWLAGGWGFPLAFHLFQYLALVNGMLLLFNLVPAFPLDGGRVLRAVLWQRTGSLERATRTAARLGSGFGVALMTLGLLGLISGNFIGGIWMGLIGIFVRAAAQSSYQRVMLRETLRGEPAIRFAQTEVIGVPPDLTLRALVDDYVFRFHHDLFPVVESGRLLGSVAVRDLDRVPRAEWDVGRIRDVMEEVSPESTIDHTADAAEALSRMAAAGRSRLLLVDSRGVLRGVLTLKDMLEFFQLKLSLGG